MAQHDDRCPLSRARMDRVLSSPKPTARSVLVAIERTKLTATYVNAIAGAIFTVGGLAPNFATIHNSRPTDLADAGYHRRGCHLLDHERDATLLRGALSEELQ